MTSKQIVLHFLDEILGILGMGVALFWSAGRIDWWPAWAVIAVWVAWYAAMDIVLFRLHPDLLIERLSPPRGAKTWDRTIMSILRLTQLARYILAGLDQRYGWTGSFPPAAQISSIMVCGLSGALFSWALASNAFFSQIFRIQSDHGHSVASGGPYRLVRHPGYLALIFFELALSTLLGSWAAIIAGGVCGILVIVRTALEDRTLQVELAGYPEYARRVKYRLLPGIW